MTLCSEICHSAVKTTLRFLQRNGIVLAEKRASEAREREFGLPRHELRRRTLQTSAARNVEFRLPRHGFSALKTSQNHRLSVLFFPIKEGRKRTQEMQASEPQSVTSEPRECVLFSLGTARALPRHSRAVGRKQDVSRNSRNRSKVSTALRLRKMEGSEIWR